MSEGINLFEVFNAVSGALQDQRDTLNAADDHNQNHGDNMVQIFEVITKAMKEKQGADPADQLQYASDLLRQASDSGSAQMYVRGLASAAQEVQGKGLSLESVVPIVQNLLNGGEAAPAADAGDMIGSLLSGLTGEGDGDSGLDAGDLLNAGMAFLQSRQSGDSNLEALADALVSNSAMGQSSHRSQSGQVVTNTILQLLSGLGK